ncbi:MAG TPA: tetratricopeptide repeat protein [Bacteroidetes bacterium]|nr:tetratricopeptide repeat protein [Bacteroidota bacterium]
MKKILLFLSLGLLISLSANAQKNKRTSAYMYNKNGEYGKAMEAINDAIKNEKTMNDAKTWMYRGEIYYHIAASDKPEINALAKNAAITSYESFAKAKELDKKGTFNGEITLNLINLTNLFYKKGSETYQNKDYEKSMRDFDYAYKIANLEDRLDTIAAFYAGMSAYFIDSAKVADQYLKTVYESGFNDPTIYIFYNRTLKMLGDTAQAIAVLQQGRERNPGNLSLLLEEAQIYLEKGETEKLQVSLKEAIKKDTTNANLYFLLGKTYDDEGQKEEAEKYYTKATQANPKFFEAFYNIGAIYVNQAAELQKEANDLPLDKVDEYNKLIKKANEELTYALPYLEKAHEINKTDKVTINALKEAYVRLKMNDKLKELNNE